MQNGECVDPRYTQPKSKGFLKQTVASSEVSCATDSPLCIMMKGSFSKQERPGLVVLTIELEKALSQTGSNMQPTKTWSPYRDPLAKFLNKYSKEVNHLAIRLFDS